MTSTDTPDTEPESNERFFRHFQNEVTALQEQMDRLINTSASGGERSDAIDHCLAGITRLAQEVNSASSYIPAYDQRTYSAAIKALNDRLSDVRAAIAPKAKFSFKSVPKNASAISLNDAAEIAKQHRIERLGGKSGKDDSTTSSMDSSMAVTPTEARSPNLVNSDAVAEDDLLSSGDDALMHEVSVRKPSFSQATNIAISKEKNAHIILPSSASHATTQGALTNLRRCVVDMSVLTARGKPFAGLIVKNVKHSLLICGQVAGPAHITGLHNCIVLINSRQFRMHECTNVDVYLWCGSRPIVEDVKDVRFAPLPEKYLTEDDKTKTNMWQDVDDFKWLKSEQSPNWSVLPENDRLEHSIWTDVVPGGPGQGLEDILKAVRIWPEKSNAEK
ncbi:hypothetical protein K402DRAFT_328947 [Aulographum hederae CBS 113979]|uniref:C-CAP/cofactor C-like domain-containing protein n=1 Tax=Aulographum hederae CBS 113979 TaxID=1176131 RepID=A0A6G1H598_9PEZI|nr:hypothetical protein K402DRAFT_328947 [Aulographum hederae CBS 113979]